jgi:hypothetical protein
MAIPAQAAIYFGSQAPSATGQILASGGADQTELAYKGRVQFVLDGATTSAVVNFIDGTQTLPFTPSAVLVSQTVGTQGPIAMSVSAITSATFTVTLASAGTSANTLGVVFLALK